MAATGIEVGSAMDLAQKGSSCSSSLRQAAVGVGVGVAATEVFAEIARWTIAYTSPLPVAFAGACFVGSQERQKIADCQMKAYSTVAER